MNTFFNKYNKYKLKYLYLKGGTRVDVYTSIEVEIPIEHLLTLSKNSEIKTEIDKLMTKLKENRTDDKIIQYTLNDEKYQKKSKEISEYYEEIRNTNNFYLVEEKLIDLLTILEDICNSGKLYGTEQIECSIQNNIGKLIIDDIILIRYLIDLISISKNKYNGILYKETYGKYFGLLELLAFPPKQQPKIKTTTQQLKPRV